MRILLLGAGALGSLFGARLYAAGCTPVLFGLNTDHLQAVAAHGLRVDELDGGQSTWPLSVCLSPDQIAPAPDVVLVLVKAYAAAQAVASVLPACHQQTLFVTLQNGMGNLEQIEQHVPAERIVAGVTAQAATMLAPGHIRHGGNGPTTLGSVRPRPPTMLLYLVQALDRAGVECASTDNILEHVWAKLLVNIGINAVTALTGVANGWIADCAPARETAVAAVQEAMQVARAQGVEVAADTVDKVLAVARATAANHSSMLQDVRNGYQTEVAAINGMICHWGRQQAIPTPVNTTLYHLIQTIELRAASKA